MKVPLTIVDHLDRAELVYGRRTVLVDEPDQPAASWGELTCRRDGGARPGPGRRRSTTSAWRTANGSRSSAQNSARLLTAFCGVSGYGRVLVPINFRLDADEVALHRRALRRVGAARRSRARRRARATSTCEAPFVIGAETDDELLPLRRRAGAVGRPTRTRPRRSTTRAARRRARRACSSRTATSGSTRRPSAGRLGVNDRDVYLHTLPMFHCNGWGMTYAVTGMGGQHVVLRKVDGAEILRRVERTASR